MITTERIEELVEEKVAGTSLFAVEVKVTAGNQIHVLLDNDNGIAISDCVAVSRHIEGSFDREVEDFELKVSSPGADQPLRVWRQYKKNVGRSVKVKTLEEGIFEGELVSAEENNIVLQWKTKERIEGRKAKQWVDHEKTIALQDVEETKVILSFK